MNKIQRALGVNGEYVPGTAFDWEAQEEQKNLRILERKKIKKALKEKEHKEKKLLKEKRENDHSLFKV